MLSWEATARSPASSTRSSSTPDTRRWLSCAAPSRPRRSPARASAPGCSTSSATTSTPSPPPSRAATSVVFAAGGGPDGNIERKRTVDLEGSLKSIEAAERVGIRRFVQISAIGVDEQLPDDAGDVWRAYVEAKRDADTALRASGLDWTILRPGRLTDDPATGRVALGDDVARSEVPRADVAAVTAAVLDDDRSIGHQWNLVSGDTPVPDAITTAAK